MASTCAATAASICAIIRSTASNSADRSGAVVVEDPFITTSVRQDIWGMRATMRRLVVSSSICSHGP